MKHIDIKLSVLSFEPQFKQQFSFTNRSLDIEYITKNSFYYLKSWSSLALWSLSISNINSFIYFYEYAKY